MDSLLLLAAVAGLPIALALVFRVSGVFLYLSMAAGYLMVQYLGDDAALVVGMAVRGQNSDFIASIVLLLLPVVMSLVLLKKTLPKHKVLLHVPLIIAVGLSLAVLALPLLGSEAQEAVYTNQYGGMLRESQDLVIGTATIAALLIMWLTYRHKGDSKHKKLHR